MTIEFATLTALVAAMGLMIASTVVPVEGLGASMFNDINVGAVVETAPATHEDFDAKFVSAHPILN